jgi:glycosidase
LKGISEKVPYLKEIGMTGVWLSPIFQSPMADFGYDISNYTAIHFEYGTMEDFEYLVKRCKQYGMKCYRQLFLEVFLKIFESFLRFFYNLKTLNQASS